MLCSYNIPAEGDRDSLWVEILSDGLTRAFGLGGCVGASSYLATCVVRSFSNSPLKFTLERFLVQPKCFRGSPLVPDANERVRIGEVDRDRTCRIWVASAPLVSYQWVKRY
ncbi:hypothetical protein CKA32_002144 [Geitlerinema sp. FC II]|nr:hypothetical protein CKA32_002144 [Geitlerinema sp. FC II]